MIAGIVGKIGRTTVLVILVLMVVFGALLAVTQYTDVGFVSAVRSEEFTLADYELAVIPDSVLEDAQKLANELSGGSSEESDNFVAQLLATYLEARDKDFLLLYNPGGWGSSTLRDSPGWQSIASGIESQLNSLGYEMLPLNYRRTQDSWLGFLDEISEMAVSYNQKARTLAARLDFLTGHNPDIKVIMASESNGNIISDSVMALLQDNDRIYGIQTGSPFWYQSTTLERTLVMNDNGVVPDSFSQGNFPAMIMANFKVWFGLSLPEDNAGHVLHVVQAPGHYYSWQYPKVYREINAFLEQILTGSSDPSRIRISS
jgi:hypothetical protein